MLMKAVVAAGCTALVLLSAACGGRESSERASAAAASADTAGLRAVYEEIDSAYDSLTARYDLMASQLSPQQRQLDEAMQQMHDQAKGVRAMLMGGGGMMGGRSTMGGGGMMQRAGGGMGSGAAREWDQQMMGMHEAMAAMFQQAGLEGLAALHQRMARLYGRALEYATPSAPAEPPSEPSATEREEAVAGPSVFAQNCAACHGPDGRGVAGLFPPLAASDWVAADPETPIRIVLHGLQGPLDVQGRTFNGVMPGFGARLTDRELAAVISYVRSAFGNSAAAVDAGSVGAVREADADRTGAMTPDELR